MSGPETVPCTACRAPTLVARREGGRAIALDAEPHDLGTLRTLVVNWVLLAERPDAGLPDGGWLPHEPRYRPHVETCPAAEAVRAASRFARERAGDAR